LRFESLVWENELLAKLKDKKKHVHGRCAKCLWLNVCGGNFRARAESIGDLWGPDPACYLTDEEISGAPPAVAGGSFHKRDIPQ